MKMRLLPLFPLLALLLGGCAAPSNAAIKEVIQGVYFKEVVILDKEECPLNASLDVEGVQSLWLVRYRFSDSSRESAMLIAGQDSAEFPWTVYRVAADACP